MKALVVGATGYTGKEVVRQWSERYPGQCLAHIRPSSASASGSAALFESYGAAVLSISWEAMAFQDALREHRPDVVFSLLGTTKSRGRAASKAGRVETYETIDYGLTALLIDAIVAESLSPKFVYLSSMGAGDNGAYLRARFRVEEKLKGSGLTYVSARPSFITGADREESRPMERVGAAVADGVLGVFRRFGGERLAAKYASIDAEHLASALIDLATDEKTVGIVEAGELQQRAAR